MEKRKGGGKRLGAEHRSPKKTGSRTQRPKKDREPNTKAKKRPGAEHKKDLGANTRKIWGRRRKTWRPSKKYYCEIRIE